MYISLWQINASVIPIRACSLWLIARLPHLDSLVVVAQLHRELWYPGGRGGRHGAVR